jgi:hypothetical protein
VSRLPEVGDARRAFAAMDERAKAGVPEIAPRRHYAGEVRLDAQTGRLEGEGLDAFRRVYGDLFDIEELFAQGGMAMLLHGVRVLMGGEEDLISVLSSLVMQAAGTGVLMERLRWEERS